MRFIMVMLGIAAGGMSIFVIPLGSSAPFPSLFSPVIAGMFALFFLISPRTAWGWSFAVGGMMDILVAPSTPFYFMQFSAVWAVLWGTAHATRSFSPRLHEGISMLAASCAYPALIGLLSFAYGNGMGGAGSGIGVAIALHTALGAAGIRLFRTASKVFTVPNPQNS
jgi:hypothetical protein